VNLPNSLTVGRIFMIPLLLVVLLTKPDGWRLAGISKEALGAAIFGVASLTDFLDGYVARRRKQVTGLGQWMDPLADKLLVTGALLSLLKMNLAPAWMVAVILGREFFVTVLRTIVHARGQSLPASPIGKVKLVAQVVAILVLILGQGPLANILIVGQAALWVATLAALASAMDYWRKFNRLPPARPGSDQNSDTPRGRISA
jgi:CDP-diacylglycerol--glycerol-3-phosphate 3-phosphatidyltransferase